MNAVLTVLVSIFATINVASASIDFAGPYPLSTATLRADKAEGTLSAITTADLTMYSQLSGGAPTEFEMTLFTGTNTERVARFQISTVERINKDITEYRATQTSSFRCVDRQMNDEMGAILPVGHQTRCISEIVRSLVVRGSESTNTWTVVLEESNQMTSTVQGSLEMSGEYQGMVYIQKEIQ